MTSCENQQYGNTSEDWRDKRVKKGLAVDYCFLRWGGGGDMGDLVWVQDFFFQTSEGNFFPALDTMRNISF